MGIPTAPGRSAAQGHVRTLTSSGVVHDLLMAGSCCCGVVVGELLRRYLPGGMPPSPPDPPVPKDQENP